jgi:hypothetical protein
MIIKFISNIGLESRGFFCLCQLLKKRNLTYCSAIDLSKIVLHFASVLTETYHTPEFAQLLDFTVQVSKNIREDTQKKEEKVK